MNDSTLDFQAAEEYIEQQQQQQQQQQQDQSPQESSVNTLLAGHLTLIGERLKDISRNIVNVRISCWRENIGFTIRQI